MRGPSGSITGVAAGMDKPDDTARGGGGVADEGPNKRRDEQRFIDR